MASLSCATRSYKASFRGSSPCRSICFFLSCVSTWHWNSVTDIVSRGASGTQICHKWFIFFLSVTVTSFPNSQRRRSIIKRRFNVDVDVDVILKDSDDCRQVNWVSIDWSTLFDWFWLKLSKAVETVCSWQFGHHLLLIKIIISIYWAPALL